MGADAARTMKRSKAIVNRMETQISEKEKLLKDIEYIDSLTMNSQASHHKRLLSVEDLQLGMKICYSSQFILQSSLISGWRFQVLTVQESHPLSIIFWGIQRQGYRRKYQPKHLSISYASQNYEDNRGTLAEFAEKNQVDYQAFLNNLRKLGMERDVFHNKIEQMSMGQRKKWNWLNLYHSQLNYIHGMNH